MMFPDHPTRAVVACGERAALEAEWDATRRVFRAFATAAPERRYHHLGLLFQRLSPWIERGVRNVALRYFLLLPVELALARLFARAARMEDLPPAHDAFLLWAEASVLRDLTEPAGELGIAHGSAGEPSPELQRRFNALPFADRALLYLYLVEGRSVAEVGRRAGLAPARAARALRRIWRRLGCGEGLRLPSGWRPPEEFPGE